MRGPTLRVRRRRNKLGIRTNKWAWRLVASNGDVIATDGSQGYSNKGDAVRMGEAIARGDYATFAIIEED